MPSFDDALRTPEATHTTLKVQSPYAAAANPPGSCPQGGGSPRTGLTSWASWEPSPGASIVGLAGRATSVPFTAVPNGPERTTTDNTEAPLTCAVPHPCRWQQRPIWLWEQGVIVPAMAQLTAAASKGSILPQISRSSRREADGNLTRGSGSAGDLIIDWLAAGGVVSGSGEPFAFPLLERG
jgi:hypothetical protein